MVNVKNRLENVFRDVFDKDDLKIFDSMTANDIEEWDSLMHINLIIAIEKEFSVKFTVTELTQLRSVKDTIMLIEKKIKRKERAS